MTLPETFEVPQQFRACMGEYEITEKIGEGTFSTVYGGVCRRTGLSVAIKAITRTTAPQRLHNELVILDELEGLNNCIPLIGAYRDNDQVLVVFPRVHAIDFLEFIRECTIHDIRRYMYSLLIAVKHMHSHSIVHRDLKPNNFMYNPAKKEGYLVDFGLAHHEKTCRQPDRKPKPPILFFNSIMVPCKPPGYYESDSRHPMKAQRAGTRGFRAPEVLFKSMRQTKAIDMWSVGVILLCMLTGQYPFFLSVDDVDGLVEIATIFGHGEMRKAARFYDRIWKCNIPTIKEDRVPFEVIIKRLNPRMEADTDVIDLLSGLLELNCDARITASDALNHPFFKDLA